ncbi:MAG: cytochrome c [Aquificae bacterium]|nr:cytochrome c [Aquificota bacterium]
MRVLIALLLVFTVSYGKNLKLKDTPPELSNYYPPKSGKMEFLELMHTLSVSMTGVVVNVREKDWENAKKWAERLQRNYLRIGEMVGKWDKLLKKKEMEAVVRAVKEKNPSAVRMNLQTVGKSCVQCHKNYKLSAKVKFHSPDFTGMKLEDPVSGMKYSIEDYMKAMTDDMKRLKVYSIDGKKDRARRAGFNFIKRFEGLTQMCGECHTGKKSEDVYFGIDVEKRVTALREAVVNVDVIRIKRNLNWLSENNCGKCHNVHETPYLLREKFGRKR